MKILVYGLNYAPEPTGIGKYTGEMAVWLAARGHAVEVICGLPHYPAWRLHADYADGRSCVERRDGVTVRRAAHFVPAVDGLDARARIRLETGFTVSAARYWLPRLFARDRPDVVIAVMPPMQVGLWPLIYGWLRRVPWVVHVQDLQVDAALRLGMLHGAFGRLLYRIESLLLRRATRVSTITEPMRRRVVAKGTAAERAWLFPNWSDVNTVRPAERDNAFRRELGLDAQACIVLYAGNMGEKQGLDLVMEAAARCRDDARIQFVLAGEGGARSRLEATAKRRSLSNVRFLPLQPLERLPLMLAAGDIHLVVQRRDAADLVMPSKLTNILAAGRPCVATADPGTALHDVVAGVGAAGAARPAGLVCAPEDADAFVAAIRRLVDDAALRETCGHNARAYAEAFLDKDAILQRFEQQLEELAKNRGQTPIDAGDECS